MNKRKKERDWYRSVTRGMGVFVCAASLALFAYLIRILAMHGPDPVLAAFFLVPAVTFAVGCVFIRISCFETIEPSEKEANTMAHRIGILSDTHGLLRPEIRDLLGSCDCIIHAGDIDKEEILRELQGIAPLYIVRGNNDRGAWADGLDEQIYAEIGGIRFFVVHDKRFAPKELRDVDVAVFGHSHQYFCEKKGDVLWLNPGSCGRKRFHLPVTMAVMEVRDQGFEVIRYDISDDREKRV